MGFFSNFFKKNNSNSYLNITIRDGVLTTYKGNDIDIVIPKSVHSIGNYAFLASTSLKSITIPNPVTSIGRSSFRNCTSLTTVTISVALRSIADEAFYECKSLKSINFGGTVGEWNAISKGNMWDKGTPSYTVNCTNGKISKHDSYIAN